MSEEKKSIYERSLEFHAQHKGKFAIASKVQLESKDDLALAYTPGVAEPCRAIQKDKQNAYTYTTKGNSVAVITDGSAVLGLGNIGGLSGLPVMEGKAILFKEFGNVDAIPICLDTQDTEAIIETIKNIAPCFGGINLEDIAAPRCFEIEKRLQAMLDIPVFHDDQHGTAIACVAALLNALKIVGKKMEEINVVVSGPGAAGISIAKLLLSFHVGNVVLVGRKGAVCKDAIWLNEEQKAMALLTNKYNESGNLREVITNKDVFIGVSGPKMADKAMIESMASHAIVFAMANPVPEIMPSEARAGGAKIVATGRSDFPNQINNVLVFPGVFRGALDCMAKCITNEMQKAATLAIANLIQENELQEDYIIPSALDKRVGKVVAQAVKEAYLKQQTP